MRTIYTLSIVLLVIGGINLGLIGFFNYDLLGNVFGWAFTRFMYAMVGLGAIYIVIYDSSKRSAITPV